MRRTIISALPAAIVVGACTAPGERSGEAPLGSAKPTTASGAGVARVAHLAHLDGGASSGELPSRQPNIGGPDHAGADSSQRAATPPSDFLAGATFDAAWTIVRDSHFDPGHLDPARGGMDWEAVRTELRPRALAARDPDDLRDVLDELLARLGQSHFEIVAAPRSEGGPVRAGAVGASPQAVPALGPVATAGLDGHSGLDLRVIDGEAVVYDLVPMLSASREGVRRGWEVVAVDGESVRAVIDHSSSDASGSWRGSILTRAVSELFEGPVGTRRVVEFRDASGASVNKSLQLGTPPGELVALDGLPELRARLTARPATEGECREAGVEPKKVGIIAFNIWMPPVVRPFHEAIDRFRDADGLVIDLRGNPGGAGFLATSLAGYLVREPVSLGDLRTRTERFRFSVTPRYMTAEGAIAEPYAGPVAVLVDDLTASTSEIFAGGLRAAHRVRLFGQPTAGATLPARTTRLPNGDTLLHAMADYTLPDGTRLEGRGLIPDESAPLRREDLLAGRDVALTLALRWIETQADADSPTSTATVR